MDQYYLDYRALVLPHAPQGGGLAQSRQGLLRLLNSSVSYNHAVYGGGLGLSQDLDVQLADGSEVVGNVADKHAGGMECLQCYEVRASRWAECVLTVTWVKGRNGGALHSTGWPLVSGLHCLECYTAQVAAGWAEGHNSSQNIV